MARRRKAGPLHRTGGYPNGNKLTDWRGNIIGDIVSKKCRRIRPTGPGAWISNERCSYVVRIGDRLYTGRGRGDGIGVSLRQMKGRSGLGGRR